MDRNSALKHVGFLSGPLHLVLYLAFLPLPRPPSISQDRRGALATPQEFLVSFFLTREGQLEENCFPFSIKMPTTLDSGTIGVLCACVCACVRVCVCVCVYAHVHGVPLFLFIPSQTVL